VGFDSLEWLVKRLGAHAELTHKLAKKLWAHWLGLGGGSARRSLRTGAGSVALAAAKQLTPGTRRALSLALYCAKIPTRRNCDAGGQNATGQSSQECQEAWSRRLAIPMGGQRILWETHPPQEVIGTVCQYPDADSARKSVTGLLREISPNPLQRSSLPMTIAELCDHFIQRELTNDHTWRSHSTKKAYKRVPASRLCSGQLAVSAPLAHLKSRSSTRQSQPGPRGPEGGL
jgi:hypothetical protein